MVRYWQHVNEASSSIIHRSLIAALSSFALVNVFNPSEHETKRVVGVMVTAGAYRQRSDSLILCVVVRGLSSLYFFKCPVQ